MPGEFTHTRMSEHLYIYLTALTHEAKYHYKQSTGQRDNKLRKRN